MNLLAVDTSSNACSIALQTPDGITDRHVVEPRAHTKILMPMISEVLADGGLSLRDLDAIVLGNGPGSFIGMRIGASVVQGLCYAANIQVIPVSSLAAIAVEVFATYENEFVVVAQDARMNEVYLACFRRGQAGIPELTNDESIVAVGELPLACPSFAAAGAAWTHYPQLVESNQHRLEAQLPILTPRAKYLLSPGQRLAETGRSISPEALNPAYLRTKVAEKPPARR
jgi:tRNA threonylcarbamoyladenosine biosynthesis protein TsaB